MYSEPLLTKGRILLKLRGSPVGRRRLRQRLAAYPFQMTQVWAWLQCSTFNSSPPQHQYRLHGATHVLFETASLHPVAVNAPLLIARDLQPEITGARACADTPHGLLRAGDRGVP